jgi:undecaprenyl diphosphate synthase
VPRTGSGPSRSRRPHRSETETGSVDGSRSVDPLGQGVIPDELDLTRVPAHVACVMDGNGRWANERGLARTEGHAAGEEALFDVVNGALAIGVKWLTLYAFSTENWRRPPDEVRYLMGFNESLLVRRRDELHEKGVRIRFAGRRDWRVPRRVLRRMDESIELTKDDRRMTMTMAFNYGGRAEIVDAVRALVEEGVSADKVDEKAIRRHLYFPDMPDPDLVIRTSGEYRISNFLLWELAYSELVFPDVLWPDMRRADLYQAVVEFQQRNRRYGGINR